MKLPNDDPATGQCTTDAASRPDRDSEPAPSDTFPVTPDLRAALEAFVDSGDRHLTRQQILDEYGHELPEEMGPGPFPVFNSVDDGTDSEPHLVAVSGDYAFCLTCETQGLLDGHLLDSAGVTLWHQRR